MRELADTECRQLRARYVISKNEAIRVMANESMEGISAVIATFYSVFQNVYETFSGEWMNMSCKTVGAFAVRLDG